MPTLALLRNRRSRRLPGLRTAKLTLAAVLAYVLASWFETSPDRILAPLTALLVVQLTLFQTLERAAGRVISVLAGVLIAVAVGHAFGLTWWSLGIVVLLSLIVGQGLRLRDHVLEVPISAMIVLAVGGATASAAGRVVETLLGGIVGLAVNAVVAPPLHVRPAEAGVERLAGRLSGALEELAADVAGGWSRGQADQWMQRSRELAGDVALADRDLLRAEESARLNPRRQVVQVARPRLRAGLTGLERCQVSLRELCRALLDRAYSVGGEPAYSDDARSALADVLRTSSHAVRSAGAFTAARQPPDQVLAAISAGLGELEHSRDQLAGLLLVDPLSDRGAWQTHGALLAAVDRLKVEIDAAVRPDAEQWRPPPVAQRQRQAVRRVVSAPRRRAR